MNLFVILCLTPSLYLCVQVRQPSGDRESQTTAAQPVHRPPAQIRTQRALGKTEGVLYSEENICKVQGGPHRKNRGGGEKQGRTRLKRRASGDVSQNYRSSTINALPRYLRTTSGMPPVTMATWLEVSPQEVQAESPRL